jgi:hypothetical protein
MGPSFGFQPRASVSSHTAHSATNTQLEVRVHD